MVRLLIIYSTILLLAVSVGAKSKKRRGVNSQTAIVKNSGTPVFPEKNFDSDPLTYLDGGQKVRISRKQYKATGGFGLFYKVVLKNGIKGYISDVEVIPEYTKTKFTKKVKENPVFDEVTKKPEPKLEPMLFTRYLAASVAMVEYTELIQNQELSSGTTMYGLKLTGPGFLFEEVPLDIDLLISTAPPSYYDEQIATAPSSGFLFLYNMALKMPFIDSDNIMVYYSLGLTGSYTKFTIPVGASNLDNQELKLGGTLGLGAAMRFNRKYFIQSDARYYHEKTKYMGYSFSFGLQY